MAERIDYLTEKDTRAVGDHLYRYWLAMREINIHEESVLDVACGYGYGSELLSFVADGVFSLDKLDFTEIKCDLNNYLMGDLNNCALPVADILISFETIEHLENPQNLICQFTKFKKVILSTPIIPTKRTNKAHLQDFTRDEVLSWFPADVWDIKWERIQNDIYIILCAEKRQ